MFIATLFTEAKTWKQLKRSSADECIDMAHTHNGVLLSYKKNKMLFATRMDIEIIILSEVRLKQKDKYHVISFICGN